MFLGQLVKWSPYVIIHQGMVNPKFLQESLSTSNLMTPTDQAAIDSAFAPAFATACALPTSQML